MRTTAQPACPNCGSPGERRYFVLRDHLYDAPGDWQMSRCLFARCGAYWLDPAPSTEDLPLAYSSYYTHHPTNERTSLRSDLRDNARSAFLSRRLGYPRSTSRAWDPLAWLVALSPRSQAWLYEYFFLPWKANGRLLEVGCGSGRQLAAMKAAGWSVRGVDFDPAAVAQARSRGLDVDIGDVRDLKLEAGTFDAVVMAHVLEHVGDPVGLLAECGRLLRPDGRLVSITPNGESLGHRIYRDAWRGLEPPRHITVFSPAALELATERAGLDVERLDVTARDAANMLLASERIRDAGAREQIERPRRGVSPPLRLHALAYAERLAIRMGYPWGEELVLTARPR